MQFGFDTIIKAVNKSFAFKKNQVTIIHLIVGLLGLGILSIIGGMLGNMLLQVVFMLLGVAFFYVVAVRTAYIATYFALDDLKSNKAEDYNAAKASFAKQKMSAIFVALVFGIAVVAVGLVEFLVIWILSKITYIGPIVSAIIFLPLFLINAVILLSLLFGSQLIFSVMIDKNTGIIATIKEVVGIITKKYQSLLIYSVLSGIVTSGLLFMLVFVAIISAIPGGWGMISAMMPFGGYGYGNGGNIVSNILMAINGIVVFACLTSFVYNIVIGVAASIYLAVKE